MRLHRLSRGTTVDVYPTGRGSAGMHEVGGRSGEQPIESDRRTRAPIAGGKEPVPGCLVRGDARTLNEQEICC